MMKFTQKTSEKSDFLSMKEKWIIITNALNKGIEKKKWTNFICLLDRLYFTRTIKGLRRKNGQTFFAFWKDFILREHSREQIKKF